MNEKELKKDLDFTATTSKGNGLRFNQGKLRYDLVEPMAHRDMVDVLTYGATKYFDRNWQGGLSWTSVIASAKRHLAALEAGEDYDNGEGGSGKLHVANLACNIHFLNAFYYTFPQGDDRPKRFNKIPKIGLDIDEVICDFLKGWMGKYEICLPKSWYFDRKILQRFDDMKSTINKKSGINELDQFYIDLDPRIQPEDIPFEPHCYITSRPVSTELTENWLDKHCFPCAPVYTVGVNESKIDIAKKAGIEIFVDDKFETFRDFNNAGITCYLFTAEHNKRYDVGHLRIDSLNDLPWFKK